MVTTRERMALAMRQHEAGRRAEAEAIYREVLAEAPEHPHALHLLGVMAHQAGRHEEAIELMQRALAVHGPHPVFSSNLASAYLALGRLDDAEAQCLTALQFKPDLAAAQQNLIAVLQRKGAIADETARHQLGIALLASGHAAKAEEQLREAIRMQPAVAAAHSDLGAALNSQDRVAEAMQCFRDALAIDPDYAQARNNLAASLEFAGRFDEAIDELRETLRRDPNNTQAIFALSELAAAGVHQFAEAEVHRVVQLARQPALSLQDCCRLNFALAQLFDAQGDIAAAFEHCRRANEARRDINSRCGIVFDPDVQRQQIDRLMAVYTQAFFARLQPFGVASEAPVFIVGMMRSGTTLVEQILASHPQVHGAGELQDVGLLATGLPGRVQSGEAYPECAAGLSAATIQAMAGEHLDKLHRLGAGTSRVVDKYPLNFFHLGLIAALFPRSRIIHCQRDPVDTCMSCWFQNFAEAFPFKVDLRHLGLYYRQYERLMAHWERVLPVQIFQVQYEELTSNQERVSRQLIAYCGLEWNGRCLRFNETSRHVRTASMAQVRKPMYKSAVGRWHRYTDLAKPLLGALGMAAPT